MGNFKISKIEVGIEYVPVSSSATTDIGAGFTYGSAGNTVSYYDNNTSKYGPAWAKSDNQEPLASGSFDLGNIAIGIQPTSGSISGISGILSNRIDYSKSIYYDGTNFRDPTITIDAKLNNINKDIKFFPFVDITYTCDASNGEFKYCSSDDEMLQVQWDPAAQGTGAYVTDNTGNAYNILGYYLLPSNMISNIGTSECPYICCYIGDSSAPSNITCFKFKSTSSIQSDFGEIFGISNISNLNNSDSSAARNNAYAFGYSNCADNAKNSFQAIGSVKINGSDYTKKVSEIVVRCYVAQNFGIITLPEQTQSGPNDNKKTFNIALADVSADNFNSNSLENKKTVTVILSVPALPSVDDLQYNIKIDGDAYKYYNKIKLRYKENESLDDFSSPRNINSKQYINFNISEEEKISARFSDNATYSDIIRYVFENTMQLPETNNIYEYYLYLKLTADDLSDKSTLIKKLFPAITVTVNNAGDFSKVDVEGIYMPTCAKKIEEPGINDNVKNLDVLIADNAMWALPISENGMLGNSNYFLNLYNDFKDDTSWYDAIKNKHNLCDADTLTSAANTITFSYDNSLAENWAEIYDSLINGMYDELKTAVNNNDNILNTCIPMLIHIKWITKADREFSTWYLIKMIVDFRNIRNSLKGDLKYLKDSDFIRNGFWQAYKTENIISNIEHIDLDIAEDPNIKEKVMSPIDILNNDLYVLHKRGETGTIKSFIEDEVKFPKNANSYITYINIYNLGDSTYMPAEYSNLIKSAYFGDKTDLLNDLSSDGYVTPEEYNYLFNKNGAESMIRSIFDTNCPINSYDELVTAVKFGASLNLTSKGFGAGAIATVYKSQEAPNAEPLLSPLHKYEDIFLSPYDLSDERLICAQSNDVLNNSIIISV